MIGDFAPVRLNIEEMDWRNAPRKRVQASALPGCVVLIADERCELFCHDCPVDKCIQEMARGS